MPVREGESPNSDNGRLGEVLYLGESQGSPESEWRMMDGRWSMMTGLMVTERMMTGWRPERVRNTRFIKCRPIQPMPQGTSAAYTSGARCGYIYM